MQLHFYLFRNKYITMNNIDYNIQAQITLTKKQIKQLKLESEKLGISISALIGQILSDYLIKTI
jgi:hypothetical protein